MTDAEYLRMCDEILNDDIGKIDPQQRELRRLNTCHLLAHELKRRIEMEQMSIVRCSMCTMPRKYGCTLPSCPLPQPPGEATP